MIEQKAFNRIYFQLMNENCIICFVSKASQREVKEAGDAIS